MTGLWEWARLVSNQRPLACEASALPLSYAPSALDASERLGVRARRRPPAAHAAAARRVWDRGRDAFPRTRLLTGARSPPLALLALPAAAPAATLKPAGEEVPRSARGGQRALQALRGAGAGDDRRQAPRAEVLPAGQRAARRPLRADHLRALRAARHDPGGRRAAHDDLVFGASSYRAASYSDPVLKKAARERARHLKTLSELKPFDSCSIMKGWAAAGWPTDWKPTGEIWEAAKAIYLPDLQIPDSGPAQATPAQARREPLAGRGDRRRRGHRPRARRLGQGRQGALPARARHRLALTRSRAPSRSGMLGPCHA